MSSHSFRGETDDERAATIAAWQRLARHLFATRVRLDLYQRQVARRMKTTTSAISRLENAAGAPPDLLTLYKYARAVGCRLEIRLIERDWREEEDDD